MDREDLTKHPDLGVRMQAQMQEHLTRLRELDRASRTHDNEWAQARSGLMQANATAALAIAVFLGLGDLTHVFDQVINDGELRVTISE